jgi:hypothetical protein
MQLLVDRWLNLDVLGVSKISSIVTVIRFAQTRKRAARAKILQRAPDSTCDAAVQSRLRCADSCSALAYKPRLHTLASQSWWY